MRGNGGARRTLAGIAAAAAARLLLAAAMAAGLTAVGYGKTRREAAIEKVLEQRPILFYVARGERDACGPGCNEWIAADGAIDGGAADRLSGFLTPQRVKLPIFFNSIGGIAEQSAKMGVMLRAHHMTVGVGRTVPQGCGDAGAAEDRCRRLIKSKAEHRARLAFDRVKCDSGCVYAIIGGSVRRFRPEVKLGVHAAQLSSEGRAKIGRALSNDELHAWIKMYVAEMGVDSGLVDLAAKVNPARIHHLSRQEIDQFGLETRRSIETEWTVYQPEPKSLFVVKSINRPDGRQAEGVETATLRLGCRNTFGFSLLYRRDLPGGSTETNPLRLVAGKVEINLGRGLRHDGAGFWGTTVEIDTLLRAAGERSLDLTEVEPGTAAEAATTATPLVRTFTTRGMAAALKELRSRCERRSET